MIKNSSRPCGKIILPENLRFLHPFEFILWVDETGESFDYCVSVLPGLATILYFDSSMKMGPEQIQRLVSRGLLDFSK
jgi:hypothetical protein